MMDTKLNSKFRFFNLRIIYGLFGIVTISLFLFYLYNTVDKIELFLSRTKNMIELRRTWDEIEKSSKDLLIQINFRSAIKQFEKNYNIFDNQLHAFIEDPVIERILRDSVEIRRKSTILLEIWHRYTEKIKPIIATIENAKNTHQFDESLLFMLGKAYGENTPDREDLNAMVGDISWLAAQKGEVYFENGYINIGTLLKEVTEVISSNILHEVKRIIAVQLVFALIVGVLVLFLTLFAQRQAQKEQMMANGLEYMDKINEINANMALLLDNVNLGILTINLDFKIDPQYSRYITTIFAVEEIPLDAGPEFVVQNSTLNASTVSQTYSVINSIIGYHTDAFELNRHLLPREFDKILPGGHKKSLEIDWLPIIKDDVTIKVMVVIKDVTELKKLHIENRVQRQEILMIGEILNIKPESCAVFFEDNSGLSRKAKTIFDHKGDKNVLITALFRLLHTAKGNARLFGFSRIENDLHLCEEALVKMREGSLPLDTDYLKREISKIDDSITAYRNLFFELHRNFSSTSEEYSAYNFFKEDLRPLLMFEESADRVSICNSIFAKIEAACYSSLKKILEIEIESMDALALAVGKPKPELILSGDVFFFSKVIGQSLQTCILHLIRNSMVHGIETEERRLKCGKQAHGTITITLTAVKNSVLIGYCDDGAGLDLAAIKKKALDLNLIDDQSRDDDVAATIFTPNFTTSRVITELAGRGAGMEIVKTALEDIGGNVTIEFTGPLTVDKHRPFKVIMDIPAKYTRQQITVERTPAQSMIDIAV
ncbi:MAG: Hpt domain-containing protein [Oligoflexales bacterium]|nr:Hpt domain-containing protein [Oligoflexales bacterium]